MIYFDNSATTRPYNEVLNSFVKVSSEYFGNPSSLHGLGLQAEKLLTQARTQIASLLTVKPTEIYFTSGGTESNNLAIKGAALTHKNKGKHLILSSVEHPSVREAMEQLKKLGFDITYLPADRNGRIMADDVKASIKKDTILVSVMQVNNEVGTIQPIAEIGKLLKQYPTILFHVDAVQAVGKVPLNIMENGIHLCSFSAHKFHGLKGTGALFIREGVRLDALLSGGNQEWKVRSGTENVAGAVAMAKALRMTLVNSELGIERMKKVKTLLRAGLSKIDDLTINTPLENSAPHILNFSIKGVKAEVLIHTLEHKGIYLSTTSACSSKKQLPSQTLLAMGVPDDLADSAFRISLSYDNTEEEAEKVIVAIEEAAKQLRKVMKTYDL
ncbi:cysteine desulfurase family protein [Neobacillus niacini]|uniref:cysteine desulfurase family protein n=1 Tax=Neobacillus niacini TaxID=86668 RepID=UPI0007AB23C0|nr:cysteine desulfurase family protein [Neobacillus niacini]MEC1521660.1 cysteine desulfurase family protein [Neobacillus niacini]